MKFVYLLCAIIVFISEVNSIDVQTADATEKKKVIAEDGIFLRKLQDKEQSTRWNDILADILVNTVSGSTNNAQKEETNEKIEHDGFLKTLFSKTLYLYKYYVYDKFKVAADNDVKIVEPEEWAGDPNDNVEVFKTNRVKGERCTTCNGTNNDDCPHGMRKNDDGKCMASPLMISVPEYCPKGYRKDRWGYCRFVFNF
ncbi:uncharacterized protein LOC128672595 [Plodia interpunctella]|uniref:uncharacterized protein LOC128672595 n=1 Tax=Plodia interpunctella TaxID=58824 RepID=UPI002367E2B1|nr:uncharacterized protein LOC128672595 [Plodia interpunctella]